MSHSYDYLNNCKKLHFAGIGGISMSTIAALALERGCTVTGSDRSRNASIERLEKRGVKIYEGHHAENVEGCDALVYTAALDPDNPELVRARELGIPLVSRGEYLGFLMSTYERRIGVSGTHGKTTTTSMISHVFLAAGLDPTVANGAVLPEIGGAYRAGGKERFVYEACEYKDSFLSFCPTDAVITNIELDHTDYFRDLEHIISSFAKAVSCAERVFVNKDNPNTMKALEHFNGKIITVSVLDPDADYYAKNVKYNHGLGSYTLCSGGDELCKIELPVIGEFNVYNSLCACAVSHAFGVSPEIISRAMSGFRGASRRFELKARVRNIDVYNDYAHHPSECALTLNAALQMGYDRIYCVFQSHTYSRTHDLLSDFESIFKDAKAKGIAVIFAPIYAARETDTMGVSAEIMARDVGALSFQSFDEIAEYLASAVQDGEMVLTMGAGDVYKIGVRLIELLSEGCK